MTTRQLAKFMTFAMTGCCGLVCPKLQAAVTPAVSAQAEPFALQDVRLLEGPFKTAMERDAQYMLSLDPDRLWDLYTHDDWKTHTSKLNHNQPGEFYDVEYALPKELTAGKVSIKFQAQPNQIAGGLYDVRILRP